VNLDELKRQAAARALDYVQGGMKLGLGTGSTAKHFVELLGARVRDGLSEIQQNTAKDRMTSAATWLRRGQGPLMVPREAPVTSAVLLARLAMMVSP